MMIDMVPGGDGVFRAVQPGTSVVRVAAPTVTAGASRAGAAAAGAGLKGFLLRAAGWAASLSLPGKILLGGAALFGISKIVGSGAPDASNLAMQHSVRT